MKLICKYNFSFTSLFLMCTFFPLFFSLTLISLLFFGIKKSLKKARDINMKIIESQNHRIVWVWRHLYTSSSSNSHCNEKGYLKLQQVAKTPIQSDQECIQGWSIYHLSRQLAPGLHRPHCKILLPYIKSKLTFYEFKTLPLVLLQQSLRKCLSTSVSQSPFKYSKVTMRFPQSVLFCRLYNSNSLRLSSQKRYFLPPVIFMALPIHSNR